MLDKSIFKIDSFRGTRVFDQDYVFLLKNQKVPFNYAFESCNIEFLKGGGFRNRSGLTDVYSSVFAPTGAVVQFWQIKNLLGTEYTNRWLVLTWDGAAGRLYDTGTGTPSTAILTITGMKYAFVINAFNRLYISPWSAWGIPLGAASADGAIWVYTGAYAARLAGNSQALPGNFVNSAFPGAVTPGLHYFGVVFETDTGFIGPLMDVAVSLVCNGNQITASVIPTGPTGTIARWIVASKLIVNSSVNLFSVNEPFFVTRIGDNTTVTLTFDMPESTLVDSAAYLIDLNVSIRAAVAMSIFNNRMIYYGIGASNPVTTDPMAAHAILVSPPGLPETVYDDEGSVYRIPIGNMYTGKVMNGAELRGVNYVFKEDSSWAIQDDPSLDPAEWKVTLVDSGFGIYPLGICGVTDNPGSLVLDNLLLAGPMGACRFTGTFDAVPITKGIVDTKLGLTPYVKLLADPVRKLIFIIQENPALPVVGGKILVGNYMDGLNDESIKWTYFTFAASSAFDGKVSDIVLRVSGSFPYPLLTLAYKSITGGSLFIHIPSENPTTWHDIDGNHVPWFYITGDTDSDKGALLTFAYLRLRALSQGGAGVETPITIGYLPLDSDTPVTIGTISPGQTPGRYFTVQLNGKVGESIKIKLSGADPAQIERLILFASEREADRPR